MLRHRRQILSPKTQGVLYFIRVVYSSMPTPGGSTVSSSFVLPYLFFFLQEMKQVGMVEDLW